MARRHEREKKNTDLSSGRLVSGDRRCFADVLMVTATVRMFHRLRDTTTMFTSNVTGTAARPSNTCTVLRRQNVHDTDIVQQKS